MSGGGLKPGSAIVPVLIIAASWIALGGLVYLVRLYWP